MVGCDMCFKWYHTKHIDFDDGLADIADYFNCTSCIENKFKPMLNYWYHMQQKKINKGNTSVMDINQIISNLYHKENHVNRNVLNNLAFRSRKIQSLIIESDEISIFSNKVLPNINSCCWLNSCLQVILSTVIKEFLLRPEFQSFSVCQYLQLIYRYLNSTERNNNNFLQMKEAVKLLCKHLQMIPQKDVQQNCLEFYDNVVRAYLEEHPGSEIANIFMGDLITTYTCANCSHFTATVTKEKAVQIRLIIASSRVSFENLLWNTMSGSSDYRERKCSECNNGNIFKEIIFNGESQVIKVSHLLRAYNTNHKPNRLKVKIPFEVDLKSFLPSFANASDSIYILLAAINFYGPTVTSGHYNCHLFTKN